MYGRKINGEVLEFGHEGVLYRRSFIMYDKSTGSLWVHVTGEAIKGERKGQKLPFLPNELVSWGDWRQRHPETKVLLGRKAHGMMGTFGDPDRPYGLSVGSGRNVRLYLNSFLERVPVVNGTFHGKPIVIGFDARTSVGGAFITRAQGRVLHFDAVIDPAEKRALMRDSETGSLWNRTLGRCVAGALEGAVLERIPSIPWLVERWQGFFPDGDVVSIPQPAGDLPPAQPPTDG